jgi:hypothetical protein
MCHNSYFNIHIVIISASAFLTASLNYSLTHSLTHSTLTLTRKK